MASQSRWQDHGSILLEMLQVCCTGHEPSSETEETRRAMILKVSGWGRWSRLDGEFWGEDN